MLYSVQVRLEEVSEISAHMAEIRAWLDSHGSNPDTSQHHMGTMGVMFRLDFGEMSDADAFVTAFDKVAAVIK